MKRSVIAVALIVAGALPALGQQSGATVTGITRDSAAHPIADVEVVAQPGNHRVRSDSAGRFSIGGLDGRKYTVAARKFGYSPTTWDVSLSKDGHADIQLVLGNRSALLDTVRIAAGRQCSDLRLDGFVCRRKGAAGGGIFLDYTDIDEKEPLYTADIFRDIKGFRVDVRRGPYGPVRVAVPVNGFGCITSLVDGRPVSGANRIPEIPYDLVAMEIYARADSVPKEYQRYTWPSNVARTGRCAVVVYWTIWAMPK